MKTLRIQKVGIELEGAWDTDFPDESRILNGEEVGIIGPDVSVHAPPAEVFAGWKHLCVGEIASPPLSLEEAPEWIKKHFPKWTDDKCGTHFHVSLTSKLNYSRLISRAFFDYFLEKTGEWGKKMAFPPEHLFWVRHAGKNRFCTKNFFPDKQMMVKKKEDDVAHTRRTMLNYCFDLHGTIECRLFPAFSEPALTISALEVWCEIVETFLREKVKKEETRYTISLEDKWEKKTFPLQG